VTEHDYVIIYFVIYGQLNTIECTQKTKSKARHS